jgi:hypothetical protein
LLNFDVACRDLCEFLRGESPKIFLFFACGSKSRRRKEEREESLSSNIVDLDSSHRHALMMPHGEMG